jgi:hypothetical protein
MLASLFERCCICVDIAPAPGSTAEAGAGGVRSRVSLDTAMARWSGRLQAGPSDGARRQRDRV